MRLVLLAPLLALPAIPAFADEPAYDFEVAPALPAPGDTVYYRLSWENKGDAPVQVPARLLDGLRVSQTVRSPGGRGAAKRIASPIIGIRTPVAASTLTWVTLQPGESLDRVGTLGELVEECQKGCPAGRTELSLSLSPAPVKDLAADQVVPALDRLEVAFDVTSRVLPVRSPDALSLTIAVRGPARGGSIQVRATVRNRSAWPLWFPRPAHLLHVCPMRFDDGRGADAGAAAGGQSDWGTADGVLLKPGGRTVFDLTCPAAPRALLRVRLWPLSGFTPERRVDAPLHFAGTLTSNEIRLP